MATHAVGRGEKPRTARRVADKPMTPWRAIKMALKPLASLHVTVVLFAMAVFLVLVGTLAQDKLDMWEVIDEYFRTSPYPPKFGFAWIGAEVLFPSAWFPRLQPEQAKAYVAAALFTSSMLAAAGCMLLMRSRTYQLGAAISLGVLGVATALMTYVFGGFVFPGGLLLGAALFINLVAAHAVRFTVQGRGIRLIAGLAVIAVGFVVTVLVIISGHNAQGLQGAPPFGWAMLWLIFKVCFSLLAIPLLVICTFLAFDVASSQRRDRKRIAYLIIVGVLTLILIALIVYLWLINPEYWVGESAMRIMWQLFQGLIAALVLAAGCILAFKKRAGIVLLHAGVGLLMFNELLVGYHAREEQMQIVEGEAGTFAVNTQALELAVIDRTNPHKDNVVIVPIAKNGRLTSLVNDEQVVRHKDLPFDVRLIDFYKNSSLVELDPGKKGRATEGLGQSYKIKSERPTSGAQSDGVNISSAYVRINKKGTSRAIGTYLLSQQVSDIQRLTLRSEMPERIKVGGKTYEVYLRWARVHKPYSVYLDDIQKQDYTGTTTPKDYSSFVHFADASRNVEFDHRIWMNNPMRYAGWTFYQSGYNKIGEKELTTLQIVKNRGWMIPYVACMIVTVGMLAHFVLGLVRFLVRLTTPPIPGEVGDTNVAKPTPAQPRSNRGGRGRQPAERDVVTPVARSSERLHPLFGWGIPLLVLLVAVLYVGRLAIPSSQSKDEMQLHEFGKQPVVFGGRAKPFDSLARNNLRSISGIETFKDEDGERQPAIRWLLDVISGSEEADRHKIFKISNFEVLDTLGLSPRPGFRYSYKELERHLPEFQKQVAKAHEDAREDKEKLTNHQRKLIDLEERVGLYQAIREAFALPSDDEDAYQRAKRAWWMALKGREMKTSRRPFAVPVKTGDQNWEPLAAAYHRVWLHDTAEEYNVETSDALAVRLVADAKAGKEKCVKENMDELVLELARDSIREQHRKLSDRQVDKFARELVDKMDAKRRKVAEQNVKDSYYERKLDEFTWMIPAALERTEYAPAVNNEPDPAARTLGNILVAYRNDDVEGFNAEVSNYEKTLQRDYDVYEGDAAKTKWEAFYNGCEMLFNSWLLYLVAFVLLGLSWMAAPLGWHKPLNRAALLLLIVVFVLHTVALVMRIYISGRPPVTNLFSSAVFIGWAAVLLGLIIELIFRIGIGNVLAALSGFLTLAIALFGLSGDGDTLGVMQAVLDTQFWLATHVVCITLGYATTFVAGLFGVVFIVLGLCTPLLPRKVFRDWTWSRVITALIYGIVCFAIFFSFVGTVLGGLWADDSWGRFWGWDPKENGALIIVLWNALVLHARWGGMVKDRGLAVLAVGGNIVTSWSWFGVNQLGIGLHSYGFTEGVLVMLGLFVLSQLVFMLIGLIPKNLWWSFREQNEVVDAEVV